LPMFDVDRLRADIEFEAELRGQRLRFATRFGLFSPRAVDEGTRLLLDHIEVRAADDCLDLGCGYGAIGLTLARLAPQGHTVLVDRDVVAFEYARRNIEANAITNAEALLGDGFEHFGTGGAGRAFDLVASNLPAKAGNEALYLLLADAYTHLKPGGRCTVVTLSGMRRFIERAMLEVFGSYDKVKQGRTHTVSTAVRAIEGRADYTPESPAAE
jgi:16S rRNA (guanine1207-N2)-methyltransferase